MTTKIIVSDHAIIRYMERVMGLNFYDIKKEIVSDKLSSILQDCGDGKYPIEGTKCRTVILNGVAVTVIA